MLNEMYRTVILLLFSTVVFSSSSRIPSFVTPYARPARDLRQQYGNGQMGVPEIYEMKISSSVSSRYATTVVTSKVRNRELYAQEANFSVILPESAFITGLTMEIADQNYTAYIIEAYEAEKRYNTAVSEGHGAALVAARDSNMFTVSVNVEPLTKAVFYLHYEELLERKRVYELVLNIHPNQTVSNLKVEVSIKESAPISKVTTKIRSGNNRLVKENEQALAINLDPMSAHVEVSLNETQQKKYAQLFGTDEKLGFSGQFVVQYGVKRNSSGGEILVRDGHFVHFFAPDRTPMPKHIIFVLDTSDSMWGDRIDQLKDAMRSIFNELGENDIFHLVEYNSDVIVWNINRQRQSIKCPRKGCERNQVFPDAFPGDEDTINKANLAVDKLSAKGLTNIYEALRVAIILAKNQRAKSNGRIIQPLIMFFTDGEPTCGSVTEKDKIISKVTEMNDNIPIFSLSFGDEADRGFLEELSLQNNGFARHIYEASDSSLQLEKFFEEISSPSLANVTFKYTNGARKLTRTSFPNYFDGSEIKVAGRFDQDIGNSVVSGLGNTGPIQVKPKVVTSVGDLERIWAYLTVQQLLENRVTADNKAEIEQKVLAISVMYSFVTPVTSLVFVKPNPITKAGFKKRPFIPTPKRSLEIHGFTDEDPTPTPMQHQVTETFVEPRLKQLMSALPWLSSIYNRRNDSLTFSMGSYKLGLDGQVDETKLCAKAPNARFGHCKLLHNCPQSLGAISTLNSYVLHFCAIGSYAGICCPSEDVIIL